MTKILEMANTLVWGAPALVLILGVGLYLSIRTGFAQITLLPRALAKFCRMLLPRRTENAGSSFRALCTALAATVGTGNLVGVAGAICIGGPGSIFWMWLCGILGMATKFAEATLAVRYRKRSGGEWLGGPMYIISQAMGPKARPLAWSYCLFGIFAAFGVGNATQINAVVTGIGTILGGTSRRTDLLIGIAAAVVVAAVVVGGAKRIGMAAERLVPFAAGGYILLCVFVLAVCHDRVGSAFRAIILGAFDPRAVTGGVLGSAFTALRTGCARGVFTNEAGMGTAAMAHACADAEHPVDQGLMGIMEVFLDTILICTLTALVILCSGVPIPYGTDAGAELATRAFSTVCGNWASGAITGALACFAFATVLGWGLYGIRCAQFLFGSGSLKWFLPLQSMALVLGAVCDTALVWSAAEIVNGLMAIPNLIMLACLSPELSRLAKEYKQKSGDIAAGGGNYADFHQRKPLRALSHAEVPPAGGCRQEAG